MPKAANTNSTSDFACLLWLYDKAISDLRQLRSRDRRKANAATEREVGREESPEIEAAEALTDTLVEKIITHPAESLPDLARKIRALARHDAYHADLDDGMDLLGAIYADVQRLAGTQP